MRTRSNRTRRGSGLMSLGRAAMGNIANGGGRLAQFNIILNNVKDWRKFKRMLVVMGGDNINDSKWDSIHLKDDKTKDPNEAPLAEAVLVDGKLPEATEVQTATEVKSKGGTRKNKRNRI